MQLSHTTTTTSKSPSQHPPTTAPLIIRAVSPDTDKSATPSQQSQMDNKDDSTDNGLQRKKSLWEIIKPTLSRSEGAAPYSYLKARKIRKGKRPEKPLRSSRKDTLVNDGEYGLDVEDSAPVTAAEDQEDSREQDDGTKLTSQGPVGGVRGVQHQQRKDANTLAPQEDEIRPDDDYEGDVSSAESSAAVEDATSASNSPATSDIIRRWSDWQKSMPWHRGTSDRRRSSTEVDSPGPLDRPASPARSASGRIINKGKQRAVDVPREEAVPPRPHRTHPMTPALAKWLDRPGPSNWQEYIGPGTTEPLLDRSTHGDSPYPRPLYKQNAEWEKARADYLRPGRSNHGCYHPGGNCAFTGSVVIREEDSEPRLRFAATPKRDWWVSGSDKGGGEKSRFSRWLRGSWDRIRGRKEQKGGVFSKSEGEEVRRGDTDGETGSGGGDAGGAQTI
ncbi:hypothetical protein K490DRAFT_56346 [Saccharata proteae CBS 121410]|uniref:Uncharacterized protein n=1 Tax=Saccharata proteae CBS 121410 TaxID=1314787 RepID=A0A9P4HXM1_9PEZI|nr:hypothetical protein K490DRAFT_56346 [Saccharata proteae CBS 121410]